MRCIGLPTHQGHPEGNVGPNALQVAVLSPTPAELPVCTPPDFNGEYRAESTEDSRLAVTGGKQKRNSTGTELHE